MVFKAALYTSLIIFILGLIYKFSTWFTRKIGIFANNIQTSERLFSAFKGVFGAIFSSKIFILIKVFILDVVLQARIFREDLLRWFMHMFIYGGFMLLLLMHAMGSIITESLFSDYYSTLNPFMFLRDLFGFMVLVGLGIAIYRRFILKVPRLKTNAMDYYAIIILSIIMISGVILEGVKITSITEFQAMQEDYASLDDEEEIETLESYWVQYYGLVSPSVEKPFDQKVLSQGQEIHETNCIECHSPPQWAFTGYAVAKISGPIALALDGMGTATLLWYIHIFACFFGLAYLPFSKMFHIFASSVSLLVNAVMEKEKSTPANIATREAIELDACTHCGTCSLRCSVAVAFDKIGNFNILPSEKLQFLKAYAANKDLDEKGLRAIQEGIYLCTNCDRCTVVCPSGINLRDLWLNVREEFIQKGDPVSLMLSPFSFYRGLNQQELDSEDYLKPLNIAKEAIAAKYELMSKPELVVPLIPINKNFQHKVALSSQAKTFSYCFSCEN